MISHNLSVCTYVSHHTWYFYFLVRYQIWEILAYISCVSHLICITPILDGAHCQGRMRCWIYIVSQSDCFVLHSLVVCHILPYYWIYIDSRSDYFCLTLPCCISFLTTGYILSHNQITFVLHSFVVYLSLLLLDIYRLAIGLPLSYTLHIFPYHPTKPFII